MLINNVSLVTISNCQNFFTSTYCCQNHMNPRLVDSILKGSIYKPLTKPVLCLMLDTRVHAEEVGHDHVQAQNCFVSKTIPIVMQYTKQQLTIAHQS